MKARLLLAFVSGLIGGALNISTAQTNPVMMKAVVANEYGGPQVLKYQDVPKPEPKQDEILVRVIAAGVNPVDSYVRQGRFGKRGSDSGPLIIGYDIAGMVEKTGGNAKKFKPGDAVYCYLSVMRGGGYAEFAVAKESETALKPNNISFEEAAAVPLAATTAWQALVDSTKIDKGQTVLVHGGAGGGGRFVVSISTTRGGKGRADTCPPQPPTAHQLGVGQASGY